MTTPKLSNESNKDYFSISICTSRFLRRSVAVCWPFSTEQYGRYNRQQTSFLLLHGTLFYRRKMQHTNTHVQSHLIYFRYGILPASHSGEEIGLPRTRRKATGSQTATKRNWTLARKEPPNKHKHIIPKPTKITQIMKTMPKTIKSKNSQQESINKSGLLLRILRHTATS